MKNFCKKHIPFLIMTSALTLLIIFLIVILCLKTNTKIAETWTRTFARGYIALFGTISETVPFSLTELLFVIALISSVVLLAWGFCLLGNGNKWAFVNRVLIVALTIVGAVTMYNASVTMAYNRKALPLERYKGEIKKDEFVQIATYFVEDFNNCADQLTFDENGEIVAPYSQKELIKNLKAEFAKLDNDYYNPYTPTAKPLLTSGLFTTVSIVGMFFGTLGEANYSTYSTNAELPMYIAHEMCHAKGVMREDDAQLLSLYICLNSEDPLLRYSAYWFSIDSVIDIISLSDTPEERSEVIKKINQKIRDNFKYIVNHWDGMTFLSDLGDKINNLYLKISGQFNGTAAYVDTNTEVNEETGEVITLSNFQSIYFKMYYDRSV